MKNPSYNLFSNGKSKTYKIPLSCILPFGIYIHFKLTLGFPKNIVLKRGINPDSLLCFQELS